MEYFIQKWIDMMVKFLTNDELDNDEIIFPVDEFIYDQNDTDEIRYM